jgi:hypothetical protein
MQVIQHSASHSVHSFSGYAAQPRHSPERPFHLKVLATPDERIAIAGLRKFAPMGVEDDLGAGLMPYEALRDDVGVVTGLYHRDKLVATMRFVPSGYRLTAAERLDSSVAKLRKWQGPAVGRLGVSSSHQMSARPSCCIVVWRCPCVLSRVATKLRASMRLPPFRWPACGAGSVCIRSPHSPARVARRFSWWLVPFRMSLPLWRCPRPRFR